MPYIDPKRRPDFNGFLLLLGNKIETEGEMNYCLTVLCHLYMKKHGLRYHNVARVTGVLENVQQEFYRRVAIDYEDKQIEKNGDVDVDNLLLDALKDSFKDQDGQVIASG